MRVAYADPPYPGQSAKHYGAHPDFAGEVDHPKLIARLEDEFPDGWALSTGAKNLRDLLLLAPSETRVLIWDKKAGTPFGDHFYWRWEPVLLRGCRRPSGYPHTLVQALPQGFTHTFRDAPDGHVTGAKPEAFSRWLFDCMGLQLDDEFVDLFLGSGAVSRAHESWRAQPSLLVAAPAEHPTGPQGGRSEGEPGGGGER